MVKGALGALKQKECGCNASQWQDLLQQKVSREMLHNLPPANTWLMTVCWKTFVRQPTAANNKVWQDWCYTCRLLTLILLLLHVMIASVITLTSVGVWTLNVWGETFCRLWFYNYRLPISCMDKQPEISRTRSLEVPGVLSPFYCFSIGREFQKRWISCSFLFLCMGYTVPTLVPPKRKHSEMSSFAVLVVPLKIFIKEDNLYFYICHLPCSGFT